MYQDINYTTVFRSQSKKKIVTVILTALFATELGQLVINWYYTDICFLGATYNRPNTFILTVMGTSVANTLSVLIRGIGEILADALLVCAKLTLMALHKPLIKVVRSGVPTIYWLSDNTLGWGSSPSI